MTDQPTPVRGAERGEYADPILPSHTARLLAVLYEAEQTDDLNWTVWGGAVSFWLGCSDTFAWGTADSERVSSDEDVSLLAQCIADLHECGNYAEVYASELYASRKRGMRPMRLWLGTHPAQVDGTYTTHKGLAAEHPTAVPLFLAAGPERDPRSEG